MDPFSLTPTPSFSLPHSVVPPPFATATVSPPSLPPFGITRSLFALAIATVFVCVLCNIFNKLDKNDDGKISCSELKAMLLKFMMNRASGGKLAALRGTQI